MLIIIKISFVSFFSFLVAGQGEIYVLGRSPGIIRTRENIMYYIIYISINIIYIYIAYIMNVYADFKSNNNI